MLSGVCEVSPDIRIAHSVAHFYVCHEIHVVILYASFCKSVDIGSIPVRASIGQRIARLAVSGVESLPLPFRCSVVSFTVR
jgi:hypothetical protein